MGSPHGRRCDTNKMTIRLAPPGHNNNFATKEVAALRIGGIVRDRFASGRLGVEIGPQRARLARSKGTFQRERAARRGRVCAKSRPDAVRRVVGARARPDERLIAADDRVRIVRRIASVSGKSPGFGECEITHSSRA